MTRAIPVVRRSVTRLTEHGVKIVDGGLQAARYLCHASADDEKRDSQRLRTLQKRCETATVCLLLLIVHCNIDLARQGDYSATGPGYGIGRILAHPGRISTMVDATRGIHCFKITSSASNMMRLRYINPVVRLFSSSNTVFHL